jgi:diguanylate cyclase
MACQQVAAGGRDMTVMMVDVDHFKAINDRFSHIMGDRTLAEVARTLARCFRERDIVARFGGEEFVIVVTDVALGQARALAQRVCDSIRHVDWTTLHPDLRVTVSIGLAHNREAHSSERMLLLADERLYDAKHAGRDRVMPAPADVLS